MYNFAHTCQPTLNACTISPLPLEAGRGWKATLYSCANLSMIHHVTAPATYPREARKQHIVEFQHHFHQPSNSHPTGNSQTRGPMDRCAHASSFVRIAHTLQRVVCTLSLGSKSRTTVLGSARQNKSPQSRWPSIHASLSFHLMFSLSSSAAPNHLQYLRNQYFTSGDNSPTIYHSS